MEKRVFKSVSHLECVGTSWHGVLIRSSLSQLLRFFGLKLCNVDLGSQYDKTRYSLFIKTKGLPAFSVYDRCVFRCGHFTVDEFDTVVDWHLGTFNEYVDRRTVSLLRNLGLDICYFSVDSFESVDDLPF